MFRTVVDTISAWAIPVILIGILICGLIRRVKVYPAFLEGAKGGFETGVRIIPPLVGIMVALGMLRASGALGAFAAFVAPAMNRVGVPLEALPMMLIRPLSGSAATGVLGDVFIKQGPDSYVGRLVSVMSGSTETTFYVLAVYMGSVGIKRYRHALAAGLTADLVGYIASIVVVRAFFG